MDKEIQLQKGILHYDLATSKRARGMHLIVNMNGDVRLIVPEGTASTLVDDFIARKSDWVFNKLSYFESIKDKVFLSHDRKQYQRYKEKARELAESRVAYYNQLYHCKVNSISVKNTKSRWGSCSKQGNLNFNYKIALLPQDLADYVIVHELCHLKELNHSQKFWDLVAVALPNYKELRAKFL